MKLQTLFIILITTGLALSSCTKDQVTPSQDITKVSMYFTDYQKLNISGTFEVFVNYSEYEESIEIEANANLHQYIIAEQKGDRLIIKLKNNTRILGNHEVMRVYVTTRNIEEYNVSGVSSIDLQSVAKSTNTLDAKVSGASEIEDFDLTVNDVDMNLAGACTASLTVHGDITITASGNSKFYYKGSGKIVKQSMSGNSTVEKLN